MRIATLTLGAVILATLAGCGGATEGVNDSLDDSTSTLATTMTHAEATKLFTDNGLAIWSTDSCSTRTNPKCTSFEGIRVATAGAIVAFKNITGCAVTITGGTECGHETDGDTCEVHDASRKSHYNGWKVDISRTTCVTEYITENMTYIGDRASDKAPQYESNSGNIYADEKKYNHWDILYTQE